MCSPSNAATVAPPRPCGTASTHQVDASTAGPTLESAAKKWVRQIHEGWLKMINQGIEQKQSVAGTSTSHGVINEIILKFETSLPWLNRNGVDM
jgi:hypothetical protein